MSKINYFFNKQISDRQDLDKADGKLRGWLDSHSIAIYVGVFCIFVLFASMANFSLLLGENLMKWDIWDGEYPKQVLMSDALRKGTVPIWNPLAQYGTPHYAMVGSPVWYPVTLLLAIIGYTPVILAFSYVIHVAIGGFGMFLLGQKELRQKGEKWTLSIFVSSLIVGLLYCNSGLFLSNAEHIMIIIAAAWAPYVFFFMRKYLEEQFIIYAMLAGVAAGMILLGGYPELFCDVFIFLIPYTVYFQYEKKRSIWNNLLKSSWSYILVCLCTVCCSAITLIPFLKIMGLLTRTSGLGMIPFTNSMNVLLSLIFPHVSSWITNEEISMINYYMGILTILLIPASIKIRDKNKHFYFEMVIGALALCICSFSFLHSLLYRFFPMYKSFRFPTVNRCILAIFLLLIIVKVLQNIMEHREVFDVLELSKKLFIFILIVAGVAGIIGYISNESSNIQKTYILSFSNAAYVAAIIIGGYLVLFYNIHYKNIKGMLLKVVLLGLVVFEILTFHSAEFPLTIARYGQTSYGNRNDVRKSVDEAFSINENRNREVDFVNSRRSVSGLNSQNVVFNKVLDEDGYVSIKLDSIQSYKNTYLRSIMEQNPEAYFTNDIVTSKDVDYSSWAHSGNIPPEQIYVDGEEIIVGEKVRFSQKEVDSTPLTMTLNEEDILFIEGPISSGAEYTGRLRFYYGINMADTQNLALVFYDEDGKEQQYQGEYLVHENENGYYVDVYLPDINTTYSKVSVISTETKPSSVSLVYVERMQRDEYVNITSFGFNDMTMTVVAPSDGYVTILQAQYNGWKAYVDGQKAEIILVDNCFMGIRVPKGSHEITMKFRPWDFYIGAMVSGLYFLAIGGIMIRRYIHLHRKTNAY